MTLVLAHMRMQPPMRLCGGVAGDTFFDIGHFMNGHIFRATVASNRESYACCWSGWWCGWEVFPESVGERVACCAACYDAETCLPLSLVTVLSWCWLRFVYVLTRHACQSGFHTSGFSVTILIYLGGGLIRLILGCVRP
jgi:hypothetical protein